MSENMNICAECGYVSRRADDFEFHPYPFCLLVRAGWDPWALVLDAHAALLRGEGPGGKPEGEGSA